ncbi:uncharacterized protein TRIADDRAFT_61396 [Trichoplax adhaerens]|uniref:Ionotropic glutamate receptor C-terminal domain-containing protein n=1 Tax=Trichoplax adhaerens TaxID=10228 RepID=B3SAV8_TRIAD|nr:hypothetical protein TRIADDRAFT_61396 [Trichoplax adhaerens]EDV20222.1 hypothetical protein TRIADDRAFT_61396 [Trichoplax adhaerens]|eukprot:XP_002117383.1 hypothetical protein TRIADDRAFT_61396 [Trichoplax adhaerens]
MLKEKKQIKTKKLVCTRTNPIPWVDGNQVFKSIKKASGPSTMLSINFTSDGGPAYINYNIVNLHGETWAQVGNWSNHHSLSLDHDRTYFLEGVNRISDSGSFISGKNLTATIILSAPFIMIDNDYAITGKKYKGYIIDLMDEISRNLNFSYNVRVVADGFYGTEISVNGTFTWSGIIGEILNGVNIRVYVNIYMIFDNVRQTDIGAAPLSITPERQQIIDFTMPFLDEALTILTATKATQPASLFQAFSPLKTEVWIGILISMIIVAAVITCMNRWSPFDYYGRAIYRLRASNKSKHMENGLQNSYKYWQIEKESESEVFSFSNNLWYALASILLQGPDRTPRSISARLITAIWWFASVIITATYTANLTAFLTINSLHTTFSSLQDLARNPDLNYGVLANSSYESFFSKTTISPYQEMKKNLKNVITTEDGIQRVLTSKNEQYAFIGGATMLSYAQNRLSLAVPKGSPYWEEINMQILKLNELGYLDKLKAKWIDGKCKNNAQASSHDPIKFENLAGVFYMLLAAIGFSFAILFIEWIVAAIKDTRSTSTRVMSFERAMKQRLRYVLDDLLSDLSYRTKVDELNSKDLYQIGSRKGSTMI